MKEFYSHILSERVKVSVTTRVMRNIDNRGGFDNYMMETPDRLFPNQHAMDLKLKMEKKLIENNRNEFFGTQATSGKQ